MTDILDRLAGYAPDSPVARLRDGRRQARDNAQASYRALFEPEDPGGVGRRERYAVAAFVAGLHADHAASDHYRGLLATEAPEILDSLTREADRGRTEGPYGAYPAGPLSVENRSGPVFVVSDAARAGLGPRLAAALEHAHLLVFRPREASRAALQALADAGWRTAEIVTLSQLVAFLSFQIRAAAGLRVLAGNAS